MTAQGQMEEYRLRSIQLKTINTALTGAFLHLKPEESDLMWCDLIYCTSDL